MISPILKKWDRLLRSNYRAISLLFIQGKVFLRILLERMKVKIENRLRESQFGKRYCRRNLHCASKKVPCTSIFIDFKSAFDTIWKQALWKMLKVIGVNEKIINILKHMYQNTQCTVMIDIVINDVVNLNSSIYNQGPG